MSVLADVWPLFVLIIISQLLVGPFANLAHEAGHVVAGWVTGYRFHSCQVRPLLLVRTPRGLILKRSGRGLPKNYARLLPTTDRWLHLRYAAHVAAGPTASLVLATVAWQVVVRQDEIGSLAEWLGMGYTGWMHPSASSTWLGPGLIVPAMMLGIDSWLLSMALAAIFGCALSVVPITSRGTPNDGMLIVRAWRDVLGFERRHMLSGLAGYASMGERPSRWPEPVVRRALALAVTPADQYLAHVYAYSWALDSGATGDAGEHLDCALALATTLAAAAPSLALEAAYFSARYRHDPATARVRLEVGTKSAHVAFLRPRAEAAIALEEGRSQDALDAAEEGLAALLAARPKLKMETISAEDSLRDMIAAARVMLVG